jgi:hypothetical protein
MLPEVRLRALRRWKEVLPEAEERMEAGLPEPGRNLAEWFLTTLQGESSGAAAKS